MDVHVITAGAQSLGNGSSNCALGASPHQCRQTATGASSHVRQRHESIGGARPFAVVVQIHGLS